MGVQRASPSHHHDLGDAVMNRYNENVEKLKDVLKARDPFATADSHLVNNVIINKNKKGSYCVFKILNALFFIFFYFFLFYFFIEENKVLQY